MEWSTYIRGLIIVCAVRYSECCDGLFEGNTGIDVCQAGLIYGQQIAIRSYGAPVDTTCTCNVRLLGGDRNLIQYFSPEYDDCGMYFAVNNDRFACTNAVVGVTMTSFQVTFKKSLNADGPTACFSIRMDASDASSSAVIECASAGSILPTEPPLTAKPVTTTLTPNTTTTTTTPSMPSSTSITTTPGTEGPPTTIRSTRQPTSTATSSTVDGVTTRAVTTAASSTVASTTVSSESSTVLPTTSTTQSTTKTTEATTTIYTTVTSTTTSPSSPSPNTTVSTTEGPPTTNAPPTDTSTPIPPPTTSQPAPTTTGADVDAEPVRGGEDKEYTVVIIVSILGGCGVLIFAVAIFILCRHQRRSKERLRWRQLEGLPNGGYTTGGVVVMGDTDLWDAPSPRLSTPREAMSVINKPHILRGTPRDMYGHIPIPNSGRETRLPSHYLSRFPAHEAATHMQTLPSYREPVIRVPPYANGATATRHPDLVHANMNTSLDENTANIHMENHVSPVAMADVPPLEL